MIRKLDEPSSDDDLSSPGNSSPESRKSDSPDFDDEDPDLSEPDDEEDDDDYYSEDDDDEPDLPDDEPEIESDSGDSSKETPSRSNNRTDVQDTRPTNQQKIPIDFDLSAGLNVNKNSVGEILNNYNTKQQIKIIEEKRAAEIAAKFTAATTTAPLVFDEEKDSIQESSEEEEDDDSNNEDEDEEKGDESPSYHWGSRSPSPKKKPSSSLRSATSTFTGSAMSKLTQTDILKRMSDLLPIALAGGYTKAAVKFTGFGDEFEDAFIRVTANKKALEVLVATGECAVFEFSDKCSLEAHGEDSTLSFLRSGDTLVSLQTTRSYRTELFASVPASIIVSNPTSYATRLQSGESLRASLMLLGNKPLRHGRSVESILEGPYEENARYAPPPGPPPPVIERELIHPPTEHSAKRKNVVFVRNKVPTISRTMLLCQWINSLHVHPTMIDVITLERDFCTGLLLCDLMRVLNPDADQGPLNRRPLAKKAALANLDVGIAAVFQSNKAVHGRRIPSSLEIYQGDTQKIAIMLDEIFISFVHGPLTSKKRLHSMLKWYSTILGQYGLSFPNPSTIVEKEQNLMLLRGAFQSGLALFCIVFHFFGPTRVGDATTSNRVLIDPSRIYSVAETEEKCRSNVTYVFALLQAVGIEVLWSANEWMQFHDMEFIILQLRYIYDKLQHSECVLPVLPEPPTTLLSSTAPVDLGITLSSTTTDEFPDGIPTVVGMIFADTLLSAAVQPSLAGRASVHLTVPLAAPVRSIPSLSLPQTHKDALNDKSSVPQWNIMTNIEDLLGVTENPAEYLHIAKLQLASQTMSPNKGSGVRRGASPQQSVASPSTNADASRYRSSRGNGVCDRGVALLQLEAREAQLAASLGPSPLTSPNAQATDQAFALIQETTQRVERDQMAILKEIERQEDLLADAYILLDTNSDTYDVEEYDAAFSSLEAQRVLLESERERCDHVFAARYASLRAQKQALKVGTGQGSTFPNTPPIASLTGKNDRMISSPSARNGVHGLFSRSAPSALSSPIATNSSSNAESRSQSQSPAATRRSSISQDCLRERGVMITSTRTHNTLFKQAGQDSEAFNLHVKTPTSLRRRSMAAEIIEKNRLEKEAAATTVESPSVQFERFKSVLAENSNRWKEKHLPSEISPESRGKGESYYKIKIKPASSSPVKRVPLPAPTLDPLPITLEQHLSEIGEHAEDIIAAIKEEELHRMEYEECRREVFLAARNNVAVNSPPVPPAAPIIAPAPVALPVPDPNPKIQPRVKFSSDVPPSQSSKTSSSVPTNAPAATRKKEESPISAAQNALEDESLLREKLDQELQEKKDLQSRQQAASIRDDSSSTSTASTTSTDNAPSSPRPTELSPPTTPPSPPAPILSAVSTINTPSTSAAVSDVDKLDSPIDSPDLISPATAAASASASDADLLGDAPPPEAPLKPKPAAEKPDLPALVKWLSIPRTVVLFDTKKTASLYPKNATVLLKAIKTNASDGPSSPRSSSSKVTASSAASRPLLRASISSGGVLASGLSTKVGLPIVGYSLQFWETTGLQIVVPNKPPTFECNIGSIQEIRRGEGKEASKITITLVEDETALGESGGRKVIAFKSVVGNDDAQKYFVGLTEVRRAHDG